MLPILYRYADKQRTIEVREQLHSSECGWYKFWGLAPAHDASGQGLIMIAANRDIQTSVPPQRRGPGQ